LVKDPEYYRRIKSLFVTALELEPADRSRFLAEACPNDDSLRDNVAALLADHDQASSLLGPEQQNAIAAGLENLVRPERIGAFRIVDTLGEGGMGVVYLAEQLHSVRRLAALKVIKPGMDSRAVLARFEAERQALAMMDHPSVARVYEAGTTEDARPYFAMEFVQGEPITKYCDHRRLTTRDRLELFIRIGQGVQHAHQKGVIHRDLKPGNVLVAEHDGRPLPKIIDFGVAKATQKELNEHAVFTEQGQLLGTPEYMSPEQAGLNLQDVDTRTDVYSLGVMLYELLTGTLPFDPKSLRSAGLAEIQRIIREVEPPKPSTRLSGATKPRSHEATKGGQKETPLPGCPPVDQIARDRGTEPRHLSRQLRGDLDWIVMKCLEKDRTRRYDGPSALVEDIQKFLSHEPVSAGPPTVGYRLRKYARRHRGTLAAAAGIFLALTGGLTVSLGLYFRLRETNAQLRRQLVRADAMTQVTLDVFEGVKPAVARGRSAEMLRDIMDDWVRRIDSGRLAEAPEAELTIRKKLGEVYREISLFDNAARMFDRSEQLARSLHGNAHPEVALALMSRSNVLDRLGQKDLAKQLQEESRQIRLKHFGPDHPDVAANLHNQGTQAARTRRWKEAERLFRESLEINRKSLGPNHPNVANNLANLAAVLMQEGVRDLDQAESLQLEALTIRRINFGEDQPEVGVSLFNLAITYGLKGEAAEAGRRFVEGLAIYRRLYGSGHVKLLEMLPEYANFLKNEGRQDEAEQIRLEIQQIRSKNQAAGSSAGNP